MSLRRNARGYPWNKRHTVYHATIAARSVMDEGFKTRAQLEGRTNAVGGGTDAAISLTLDIRVARAIVLGLRVAQRIARGTQTLGDLVIQASKIAPGANEYALKDEGLLSVDEIVMIDQGYAPFRWGMGYTGRARSVNADQLQMLLSSGAARDVEEHRAGESAKPYAVNGWAPVALLAEVTASNDAWERVTPLRERLRYHWAYYKKMLAWGDMSTSEVYDPLFFNTDVEAFAKVEDDDIAILAMRVDADWLCAAPKEAEAFGFEDRPFYADSAWSEQCAHHMDGMVRHGWKAERVGGPREWEPPDPRDTVAYLGSHMAEMRAWDPTILRDVKLVESLDDVLYDVGRDWDGSRRNDGSAEFQGVIDGSIAHPYFRPKTPFVRER